MRDFTSRMHTENFVKRVKLMLNTLNTHTHTHTHTHTDFTSLFGLLQYLKGRA